MKRDFLICLLLILGVAGLLSGCGKNSGEQTGTKNYSEESQETIIDTSAEVSGEVWDELTREFFHSIDHRTASMTFEEMFGDAALPYIKELAENSMTAVQN